MRGLGWCSNVFVPDDWLEAARVSGSSNVAEFVRACIDAWSTTDAKERRSLINQVYADDAEFSADEPGDEAVQRLGRDEIEKNIAQVTSA